MPTVVGGPGVHRAYEVSLDVHARSVVARAIDGVTGEVIAGRLRPDHGEILRWLARLPAPVAVAREAGPNGFRVTRAVPSVGIRCEVAAPRSCSARPATPVKADVFDAQRLA